ncbi:DUF4232 domain-containing protein, partial [Streptomyces sp. NPDC058964]|uniref:DUF4232 domain-containing protein n=1 Tax=Streptomyces sp. NPDC058964 TaxID=3346681 RepID=UPI0036C4F6D3
MVYTSSFPRRASLLAGAAAALGLLTACGGHDVHSNPPMTAPGSAAPATETSTAGTAAASASSPAGDGTSSSAKTGGTAATTSGGGTTTGATGTRCHTSELTASVGRNDPGAGQENFPVVLTNKSARTCTVRGYPGAAFVDASGTQLGPDPKRSSGTPATVTLKPGQSAWAGLTFSNPEISGAKTATPAALLVTPPDERDQLKVKWTAGEVPVSGNASSVFLTVFGPGTG